MRRLRNTVGTIGIVALTLVAMAYWVMPWEPLEQTPAQDATPTPKPTYTISGDVTLSLFFNEISADQRQCEGPTNREEMSPPYGAGVRLGTKVVVRNEKGDIIALGELGGGEKLDQPDPACRFPLMIENVPSARFYEISIFSYAGSPTLYFSRAELRAADWVIHFTIP